VAPAGPRGEAAAGLRAARSPLIPFGTRLPVPPTRGHRLRMENARVTASGLRSVTPSAKFSSPATMAGGASRCRPGAGRAIGRLPRSRGRVKYFSTESDSAFDLASRVLDIGAGAGRASAPPGPQAGRARPSISGGGPPRLLRSRCTGDVHGIGVRTGRVAARPVRNLPHVGNNPRVIGRAGAGPVNPGRARRHGRSGGPERGRDG
jgi:hypothetical protein